MPAVSFALHQEYAVDACGISTGAGSVLMVRAPAGTLAHTLGYAGFVRGYLSYDLRILLSVNLLKP